jgi:acetolactate synthase I/II/III large subunit
LKIFSRICLRINFIHHRILQKPGSNRTRFLFPEQTELVLYAGLRNQSPYIPGRLKGDRMATVAQIFADTLAGLGVRYVFGVPSGNWVDYGEAIRKTQGIEFILVSNEASAGFMADVCWRLTGRVAACFGTFGPGACNLSTGVCCGFLDRSPMLVFADEMSDRMRNRITQMNIDQQTFFRPISKLQIRLRPDMVAKTICAAHQIAVSETPGPVYIGLPSGLGADEAVQEKPGIRPSEHFVFADPAVLDEMEELFRSSRRPVLALGITSTRSGVRSLVLKIAEKFRVPVVLTPMAKGMFPEDHPCYAGVLAHALADQVGLTHQQADLVVGIGYDPVEINYEDWIPEAPLLHIDTTPADPDKDRFALCLDVVGGLAHSLERLAEVKEPEKDWDMQALAKRRKHMFSRLEPAKGRFDACSVLAGLRRKLPANGIMTCDVGAHLHLIGQLWPTPSPECQLMTNGCSSMGFGIPAAVAAKLCCPDREVCCVTGDGGFLMMAGEMATAMRLGTKVIFVLMSDRELSLIRIKQERKGCIPYGTRLHGRGYVSSSSFFGVPVLAAHDGPEYRAALDRAFAGQGPVIIEAFVNKQDYEGLILKGNR